MSKSYCMKCKKEVNEETTKCKCGGRYFVYGENFTFGANGIICGCGNDKFKSTIHMDYTDKGVNNYICSQCKNPIGTESYRNESDMMIWGDEE